MSHKGGHSITNKLSFEEATSMSDKKKESDKIKQIKKISAGINTGNSSNSGAHDSLLQNTVQACMQSTVALIKNMTGLSTLAIATKALKIIMTKLHELHADKIKTVLIVREVHDAVL